MTELYERLLFLLKELEPWESKLVQATKRARAKLRKEKQDYVDEEEEKVLTSVFFVHLECSVGVGRGI